MTHLALNYFTLSLQQASHEASQPRGHSRIKPFSPRKVIRWLVALARIGRCHVVSTILKHPDTAEQSHSAPGRSFDD